MAEKRIIKERIPMPWAAALICCISFPFGLFLGKYNFALWVAFIVWAEYFALGASVDTWKLIIPSIPMGAATACLWMATGVFISGLGLQSQLGLVGEYISFCIGALIWVPAMMYIQPKVHAFKAGTLALFNGLTLFLGVYFTNSIPQVGPLSNPYWVLVWSYVWTILMAYFGWFLGWLNIVITFPKEITVTDKDIKHNV